MSTALAAAARTDEPLRRVLAFSRRFGRETTALAMHAALPLGLSPELVHLLRVNFVPRAPFIAEADLLLSALCAEAGGGMYEMDADVRELLLAEMARTPGYGPAQQRRVADFLRLWAARALDDTADPDLQEHLRVQQWVALAYADPARAAEELAGALREGVERADRPEVARVARLTTVLSAPLAAEVELRRYAGAVERMATTGATSTTPSGSGGVSIGRERLPSMDRVVRLWHPQPTPDVHHRSNVSDASPIQQQANVADEPAIQQQADVGDGEPIRQQASIADEPIQQQTDEGDEPSVQQQNAQDGSASTEELPGYRVARVLVLGARGVGKSALVARITRDAWETDPPTYGASITPWQAWSGDTGAQDVVFHETDLAVGPIAVQAAESSAMLVVVGPRQDGGVVDQWIAAARSANRSVPVLLVVTKSDIGFYDDYYMDDVAAKHGLELPVHVSPATGYWIPELREQIRRIVPWDRLPAAASRGEVDAAEARVDARLRSSLTAPLDGDLLARLGESTEAPRDTSPSSSDAILRCLEARGVLRIIGDPPRVIVRADAYTKCVGEIWRIAASDDQHPPGLPSVVYRTLEERFSTSGLRNFLSGDPADRVLDLVLEDLTHRGWAFRVDSRDGRQVVIPSQFRAAPMSTDAPDSDLRPVLQARWPGTLNDVFVLQLVNFANLGRVDVHAPDRAYVRLSDGLLRVDGAVSDGIAQLNLAASLDAADATVRDLFRFVMTWYLPGVAVEFTAMDSTPPDADAVVSQEAEEAAPSGGTTPASPGVPEPPAGVDLERACLVVLPFGTKQVGERVIDFDAVWEHLFKPAIEDLRLTNGEPLVPLRITPLPEPGSPLPDWMKAALLVLVDLTGADAGRIEALGLMPGRRTQHVLLFQEIYDPPRGIADDQVNGYAYGGPEELAGQRALLSQRLAETLGVPGGGTGDGTATERTGVSFAAYVRGPVSPGETIRVHAVVYEEPFRPDADRYLVAAGAAPGQTALGSKLGTLPLPTTLHFTVSSDWDHTAHETQAEWPGGWLGSEVLLTVPPETDRSSALVTVRVGGVDPPGGDVILHVRIEPPAAAENESAQQEPDTVPTGSVGVKPPAGVDLARACLVVLPVGTRQVGERSIDLDAVWEHLFRPAIRDVRLPQGGSLVPVRVSEPPASGAPFPDWVNAAKVILVDVTGAGTEQLRYLWRMPGFRTQTVVLIGEADFVARLEGTTIQRYTFGSPAELTGQRRDIVALLEKTLGVPGGGTESSATETFVVTADALNVRRGPGSEHPVVANLSKGTRVERLEAADGWLRIQTPDGITGWISTRFAAPESAQHAEPPLGKVRVTAGTLNLRAGPGTDHPVIMALTQGMVLDRLGASADERWIHVRSQDDFHGWVSSRYVETLAPEPMFMAAFAPPAAVPGETIQVRMLVYEASAKQKADEHLGQMGADFGDIEWGPALGEVSPGARLEMRFTADWLSEPEWTHLDWRGGWLSSAATLEIPVDREQGDGSVVLEVLADGVLVGQMSVMLRIERSATVPKDDAPAARIDLRTAYAAYAPEDRERARARLAAITSAGPLDVFVDELPETSDEGQRRGMDEVASRDLFLLLYSPAAARSNAVQRDWWKAVTSNLATGKPEIQVHLLEPVPLEEIPSELRDFQIIPPPDPSGPGPKADPTRFA